MSPVPGLAGGICKGSKPEVAFLSRKAVILPTGIANKVPFQIEHVVIKIIREIHFNRLPS